MTREVLEGIVVNIELVRRDLTFVTLRSNEGSSKPEKRIPVYFFVFPEFLGGPVKITTSVDREFNGFDQLITNSHISQHVVMPYSSVKEINEKCELTEIYY